MADIDNLMSKYGLDGLAIHYPTNQAWHPIISEKGYVQLFPPEDGVFSGATLDEAVAKVAAYCAT